ncbi:MAG: riboflavin synthase [Gammaproteobacteria bacterium]|nr:riboflavin synthase [Gammaproteobacteria bacterium]
MFTGIIRTVGVIAGIENTGADRRFRIDTGNGLANVPGQGDSVAVNGVCLTVIATDGDMIDVDISGETLACTTLGQYATGERVNLEPALALSDRLDGHLVSGHVDGTAEVVDVADDGRSKRIRFCCGNEIMPYITRKGSVCVDGTSLTVNSVEENRFSVNVIPHTLEQTIMSGYRPGLIVNIEVDLVARYIEKLLSASGKNL